jgi:hypothetical protein
MLRLHCFNSPFLSPNITTTIGITLETFTAPTTLQIIENYQKKAVAFSANMVLRSSHNSDKTPTVKHDTECKSLSPTYKALG